MLFRSQICMRIGFMLVAIMAAKTGSDEFAAHNIGMNIMSLSFAFGDGMQAAAVALIGRSLGQHRPDLAKQYGKICIYIGSFIAIVLSCIYFFGGRFLYSIFFTEPHIIETGVIIMRYVITIVVFQMIQVICTGCLRGAGDVLYTTIVSLITVTILRPLLSYICVYALGMGVVGIWIGIMGDQIVRFTLNSIRFGMGKWLKYKL